MDYDYAGRFVRQREYEEPNVIFTLGGDDVIVRRVIHAGRDITALLGVDRKSKRLPMAQW